MVAMTHYTVTAQRGESSSVWVLQCVEFPGAISQTRRLSEAPNLMREAISFVAEVPEDQIDVTVIPDIDEGIRHALDEIERSRAEAERLQREASATVAKVAHALVESEGLTLRDAGTILGVSHQRVSQLIR